MWNDYDCHPVLPLPHMAGLVSPVSLTVPDLVPDQRHGLCPDYPPAMPTATQTPATLLHSIGQLGHSVNLPAVTHTERLGCGG